MAPVSASEHYRRLQQSFEYFHQRIASAARAATIDWTAAHAQFDALLRELDSLAREHDQWAAAYLDDIRQAFGPSSDPERQQQQMAAGVRRWITQDQVYVLLGLATAEHLSEDWPQAERSLARASGLLDSLAAGGWLPGLLAQRLMVVSQQASVFVQLAVYHEDDSALVAKALDCARRAGEQAESRSSWFVAVEASLLAATCAKLQGDAAALERYGRRAFQLATAHEHQIGQTGDIPSLPRFVQEWITAIQAGTDRTGEIARKLSRSRKAVATDVARQLYAEVQLPGASAASGVPAGEETDGRVRVFTARAVRRLAGAGAALRVRGGRESTGADPCRGGGKATGGAGCAHQRGEFPGMAG